MRALACIIVCVAFSTAPSAAADRARVEKESKLYAEPQAAASIIGTIKEGTDAEVMGRKAAWVQVNTGNATGWIFSFNVRFLGTPGAMSVANLALPKARGGITNTIGIRGIDEEDLRQARMDDRQLRLLHGHAVSREIAHASALASSLTPAKVPYLDERMTP